MVSEALLWQFLEEHPKQNAPWCEWQDAFGGWDSFSGFETKFLQLTNQRASAVNCRTDCGLGCPRKVVEHAADDIAAVCPEQEEKPYSLNKRDVLVYTLTRSSFHKSICSGLGITRNENTLDGIPGVFRLGDYTPTAGFNFPVYLTFKSDPDALLESVMNISLLGQTPYALIIPTRKQLTPRTEDLLNRSGSICIVLSEEFSIQANGSLKALRPATDVFTTFQQMCLSRIPVAWSILIRLPVLTGAASASSLLTAIPFPSARPNHTASTITPKWEWLIPETGTRLFTGPSCGILRKTEALLITQAPRTHRSIICPSVSRIYPKS